MTKIVLNIIESVLSIFVNRISDAKKREEIKQKVQKIISEIYASFTESKKIREDLKKQNQEADKIISEL